MKCQGSHLLATVDEDGDVACPLCNRRWEDVADSGHPVHLPRHNTLPGIWDAMADRVAYDPKQGDP